MIFQLPIKEKIKKKKKLRKKTWIWRVDPGLPVGWKLSQLAHPTIYQQQNQVIPLGLVFFTRKKQVRAL
jgi:hypothetical protein